MQWRGGGVLQGAEHGREKAVLGVTALDEVKQRNETNQRIKSLSSPVIGSRKTCLAKA